MNPVYTIICALGIQGIGVAVNWGMMREFKADAKRRLGVVETKADTTAEKVANLEGRLSAAPARAR